MWLEFTLPQERGATDAAGAQASGEVDINILGLTVGETSDGQKMPIDDLRHFSRQPQYALREKVLPDASEDVSRASSGPVLSVFFPICFILCFSFPFFLASLWFLRFFGLVAAKVLWRQWQRLPLLLVRNQHFCEIHPPYRFFQELISNRDSISRQVFPCI